jgi:hypothetical protein
VENIKLGMTDDSVTMHTNPNTYLYRSAWELGTATKSLSTAMTTVQIFTVHGQAFMNRIMQLMTES